MKKRTHFASGMSTTTTFTLSLLLLTSAAGISAAQAAAVNPHVQIEQKPVQLVSDTMPSITLKDVTTPPAGSAERKAIMDVLRTTVPDEYQPVKFKVNNLKVGGGYATADVLPIKANGQPVGCVEGDDVTSEFWLKKVKGQWTIIVSNICGGDPAFNEAMEKGAPPQLLGKSSWAEIFAD